VRPRQLLAVTIVAALCLRLPSLAQGFWLDDYGYVLALEEPLAGTGEPTPPWKLYDFGGVPQVGTPLHELGSYAWWTDADWRARFLRPLTSLSLALDHAVFERNALGYHVTSLALFAALLALLPRLYVALGLAPGAALLATLLFALEDGSAVVSAWIANRNSLIEVLCGVLSLSVLARAERGRAPPAGRVALALSCAALATAAKESGVAVFAAIALWLELRHGRAGRAGAAWALGLAALYVGGYVALGYGSNCLFYIEPWREPLAWSARLATTAALAPVGLTLPFFIDAFFLDERLRTLVPVIGLVSLALVVLVGRSARHHPAAPFLAGLACLWLLPQVGAPPSDRLLFGSMVGWAPLVALFLADAWQRRAVARRALRYAAAALACLALFLSGAMLALSTLAMNRMASALRGAITTADVGAPALGRRDVFLLQASPTLFIGLVPSSAWYVETGDMDVRWWPLQMDALPLAWTRVDERTFDLASRGRPFLARPAVAPGALFTTAAFTVRALEVEGEGVRSFRVTCARALDLEPMRFLAWRDGALRRIAPPAVGETLELGPGYKHFAMP
jgi:hypothetical protein